MSPILLWAIPFDKGLISLLHTISQGGCQGALLCHGGEACHAGPLAHWPSVCLKRLLDLVGQVMDDMPPITDHS